MKKIWRLLNTSYFYVLIFLSVFSAQAFCAFEINSDSGKPLLIGKGLQFFEDKTSTYSIETIRAENIEWQTNPDKVFNQGYSASNWWIKFDIKNLGVANNMVLEISYPVLDYIDIYFEYNNELIAQYAMGDKLPFDQRPFQHRLFLAPLEMESGQTQTVYIRLNSSSSIQAPIAIRDIKEFYESDTTMSVSQGFYIGGMVVIAIYNLLVFFALRDRSYLYYVGYVLCILFFLASLNGWTFKYLWPQSTTWNDTAILVFLNGTMLFGILFAKHFLELKNLSNGLNIQANIWVGVASLCFITYLSIPYNIGIKMAIPFGAMACFWTLFSGLYAWLRGHQSAGIYVISWVGFLAGGVLLALNKLQVIPKNIITDQAIQLGSLLEVMLISFALAQRINHERSKRIYAQQKALDFQMQAKEQLEANVAERTKELKFANEKLKELSDTDQLTGLKNRRYLDHFLDHEFNRSLRYRHTMSVLLIDIDLFKSVNDTYGHLVGDICIKEVANRFSHQLRVPTDISARYGGEEFCVVLPETSIEGAMIVAERIRKSINEQKIDAQDQGFDKCISVSVGVFSKIPETNDTVSSFLNKADKALYTAKENGRNRVEYFKASSLGSK
jgi:diguanylate cyclase